MSNCVIVSNEDYISHHGIKGQKWGVRRYQNKDGSLTAEGRGRSKVDASEASAKAHQMVDNNKYIDDKDKKAAIERYSKYAKKYGTDPTNDDDFTNGKRLFELDSMQRKNNSKINKSLGDLHDAYAFVDKYKKVKVSDVVRDKADKKVETAIKKVSKLGEQEQRIMEERDYILGYSRGERFHLSPEKQRIDEARVNRMYEAYKKGRR